VGAAAIVIGIFFVAGLAVGALVVIALPVLRDPRFRRDKRNDQGGAPSQRGYDRGRPDGRADRDVTVLDDRSRWPGDAGHGYYGE
jgi:hypothetical protein